MKKRIMSLILAIAMIVTMVPEVALADESLVEPSLRFYWLQQDANANFYEDGNGNYMPDTRDPEGLAGDGQFDIMAACVSPGYFFFRDADGTETQLDYNDVTISSGSLKLEENKGATVINAMSAKVGDTAEISYTNGSTVYTFDVEVVKPYSPITGFYLGTDMGEASYNSFTITDTENVFYLNVSSGWEVQSVALDSYLDAIADYEIAQDGSYIKITVTGNPTGMYYGISYEVADSTNANDVCQLYNYVELMNGKAQLMMGFGMWDNNNYVENPNGMMTSSDRRVPGTGNDVFFYLVENDTKVRVSLDKLTSSDLNVVALEQSPLNPDAIRINPLTFGNAKINYTHTDGKTYSMDIVVDLPMVGCYNATTVSQSSFISEFAVTASNDTFYLLSSDSGRTFTSVTLEGDFANIAKATISDDKSYVTIQVTGTPRNGNNYGISFVTTTGTGDAIQTWNGSSMIRLYDKRPLLMAGFGTLDNGSFVENPNDINTQSFTVAPGTNIHVFFYLVENDVATRLSFDKLSSSNTDVLTITESTANSDAVLIKPVTFGNIKINYTHTDGKTYSMDIAVDLPMFGYYTVPTASQSTFIQGFEVTNTADTFYLVASDGWTFENVTLLYGFDDIATYTVSKDKTYVTITVNEAPVDGQWYRVGYDAVHTSGMTRNGDSLGIQLFNAKCWHESYTLVGKKNATCTTNGYTGDSVCDECGHTVKGTAIKATGHKYTKTKVEPTTKKEGYTLYKCGKCGDSYKGNYVDKLKSLAKCKFTIEESKTYTGKAIKPTITVKDGKTKLKSGTHYTVTYENNKNIGKATVTIKGKGSYTGTKKLTFEILPKKSKLSSVKSAKKKVMTVKWKKDANVTGYVLEYSLDKNFKKNVKTVKINKNNTTSKEIKKLKSGETYYVRIAGYKTVKGKTYTGEFTAAKKVKVK